jgi:hypothetical protein
MRDLGTIGGTGVYLVNNLNNRGQIAGGMNVVGDQSFHPFLWAAFRSPISVRLEEILEARTGSTKLAMSLAGRSPQGIKHHTRSCGERAC